MDFDPSFGGMELLQEHLMSLGASISQVSDLFESLASPFGKFVEALAPGEMFAFNLAMRDLNATIGQAFLPVMQALTDGVKTAAAILNPVMQQLAPAMGSLAQAVVGMIIPAIQIFASNLEGTNEFLKFLEKVFVELSSVVQAIAVVFMATTQALVKFMAGLLGGGEGGGIEAVIDTVVAAIRKFAIAILTTVAILDNTFGSGTITKNMIAALQNRAEAQGKGGIGAAPTDVGVKGIEQISKDISIAAAYATGGKPGEEPKKMEDFAADAVKALEDIRKTGTTLSNVFNEKQLEMLIARAVATGLNAGKDLIDGAATAAKERATSAARTVARVAIPGFGLFDALFGGE